MKQLVYAILLGALTGSGCVSNHEHMTAGKNAKAMPNDTAPPAPPVMAGQINTDNAHAMSQALWDEMDRQAQQEMVSKSAATPARPK